MRCPDCGRALVDVRWLDPADGVALVGDCDYCGEVYDLTDQIPVGEKPGRVGFP